MSLKKFISLMPNKALKELPLLLVLMVVGMMLEALTISLLLPVIGFMTQKDFFEKLPPLGVSILSDYSQMELIVVGFAFLLLVYTAKTFYLIYLMNSQNKYAFNVEVSLSSRLFNGYLQQPMMFHLHRNTAHLMQFVNNETRLLVVNVLLPGLTILSELLIFAGTVGLLVIFKPFESLVVLSFFTIVAFVYGAKTRKQANLLGKVRQDWDGRRLLQLKSGLHCIKEIKILQREKYFADKYYIKNKHRADAERKFKLIIDAPRMLLELTTVIGLVILVFLLLRSEKIESILPIVVLFCGVAFRLLPSINRIINSVNQLQYANKIINSLYNETLLFKEPQGKKTIQAINFNKDLVLENISFTYPNTKNKTLHNINLKILAGSSVGLYGASGAGKSTIMDLILGIISPQEGFVKADGVDIATNLKGWQKNIGYIPQKIHLLDTDIKRNVAFGLPDELIDEDKVVDALTKASLIGFVETLPNGMHTLVGEDGVRLSGGQRQRIGIARALYNNPAILVLDEATSALDASTEEVVMNFIYKMRNDKTVIVVSHRLDSLRKCDKIYKISSGRAQEVDELPTTLPA